MLGFVKKWSYGEYSNDNYGANSMAFEDKDGDIYYFSYDTLVAFNIGGEFHIRNNEWGCTTGKHLNWIDACKSIREDSETFENNFNRLAKRKEH